MRTSQLVARWAHTWQLPGLETRVRVEWSERLTRSLGRAIPARRIVRLSEALRRRPQLFKQVLCHEVAHVAAWELARRREDPHGPTWKALVRAAGYDPVLRVALRKPAASSRAKRPPFARWIHRCPVCQFRRVGRRPVPEWRCARCVESGLEGDLLITRKAAA